MTRRPSRRPLLTAVGYAAVTVAVLSFGMALMHTTLVRGEAQVVLLRVGAGLLLLGAGGLVVKALRGMIRHRGH